MYPRLTDSCVCKTCCCCNSHQAIMTVAKLWGPALAVQPAAVLNTEFWLLWNIFVFLRGSCLMLEIKGFSCYETKIEKSYKASSRWDLNPRHLHLEPPVCSATESQQPDNHHVWQPWQPDDYNSRTTTTARQPPTLTILYMYLNR